MRNLNPSEHHKDLQVGAETIFHNLIMTYKNKRLVIDTRRSMKMHRHHVEIYNEHRDIKLQKTISKQTRKEMFQERKNLQVFVTSSSCCSALSYDISDQFMPIVPASRALNKFNR